MKITNILQAFLLVSLLLCQNLVAQTYPPGYIPATPCPARGYDDKSVFDWTQDFYPFYIKSTGGAVNFINNPSPWIDYVNNPYNLGNFQFTGEADYSPEYGWVLVKKDFGTFQAATTHPYMILYNKFRGIMRIFIAISQQEGVAQKCSFIVKFPIDTPYKSGIFEFNRVGNSFNALDKFDNQIPEMRTTNRYTNTNFPHWVYTEIATAYDPCTCNYNSIFYFNVDLINTATLQFTAYGTTKL
jgi:hypothetical protein